MSLKIGIFVPNINQGGTERVAANLANEFNRLGYNVTLISLGNNEFPFPTEVRYVKLDSFLVRGKLSRFFRRYLQLRAVIAKHEIDIVLSMGEYTNFLCSLLPRRILRVVRVTNSLTEIAGFRGSIIKLLANLSVRRSDLIVVPTSDLLGEYRNSFKYENKIKVIPNPVTLSEGGLKISTERSFDPGYWLHIGQLVPQKNHHGLLDIYKRYLEKSSIKNNLVLLGKGYLENEIRSYAKKIGVSDHVIFLGWVDNTSSVISDASALVLTSLWEGFPNVLIEAMYSSLPVIAYDCHTGPKDILKNGASGILVPFQAEGLFVEAMLRLETDTELIQFYQKAGLERSRDFHLDVIANTYTNAFLEKLKEKSCIK